MENKEIERTTLLYPHNCKQCNECRQCIRDDCNNYCKRCQFIFLKKHYKNFSSGNEEVDKIIKNPIYDGRLNYYEWIPWERLLYINEIARGGFGIIYKATLIDGFIDVESIKHHGEMEYERHKKGIEVAIKIIKTNSSEVIKELYIQRAIFINYHGYEISCVSKILGITRNAETLEYGIVMEFAKHGDMRKYLSTNFHSTSWDNKLLIAYRITSGLEHIHSSGMVHRDLHSGNILQLDESWVDIGDLGLCQPTNNEAKTTTEEKKIFGVIPYIPPEVLRGEKFTTAGDIYSYGMLLWELSTGKPPFHDRSHDHLLVMAILNGARPEITSPLIPPPIAEIIIKCWDPNPKNRPTAIEVKDKLLELLDLDDSHIFERYFGESDKLLRKTLKNGSTTTKIPIHPEAVYTSRVLTAQIVNFSTELVYLPESKKVEENFE